MSVTIGARTIARPGMTRVHLRLHGTVLRLSGRGLARRHERIARPDASIARRAVQARTLSG